MAGGCHLFEMLYGREFTKDELSSQAIKTILMESLIYDNEVEQEHRRQDEFASKSSHGGMIIGSKNVNELLFQMKHPEMQDCIVTLLTTEEYLKLAKS